MPNVTYNDHTTETSLADTDRFPFWKAVGAAARNITWASLKTLLEAATMTLANKTLTAPVIADFTNAQHDHSDADDGGALSIPSASDTVQGIIEIATNLEALAGSSTSLALTPSNLSYMLTTFMRNGEMRNGKFSVTVTSSDLTVALKTILSADPSASDPVYIKLGGTVRTITSALSFTLNDATNWFNAGSAELATKEIDYFIYAVWDSNSTAVALSCARVPYGKLVSEFSATTTNEKHLANFANFTSTDSVEVVGRFAATLSAGAAYTWTVPTFTDANLIQAPIHETRLLEFTPTVTPSAGTRSSVVVTFDKYQVKGREFTFHIYETWTQNTTAADYVQFTVPFTFGLSTNFSAVCTPGAAPVSSNVTSSGSSLFVRRYDGAGAVFTVGASKDVRMAYTAALP